MMTLHSKLSAPAVEFASLFHSLDRSDQLTVTACLIEHIGLGLINERNQTGYGHTYVADSGTLMPEYIGLADCSVIASDLLSRLPEPKTKPKREESATKAPIPSDAVLAHVQPSDAAKRAEGAFYDLTYTDKLAALAELFYSMGTGTLDIRSEFLQPYETAVNLRRFRAEYMAEHGMPQDPDDEFPY